jgi:hypothetical protein
VPLTQLLGSGVSRRGLHYDLNFMDYDLSLFSLRSEAVHGFQNGFGVGDTERLLTGGSVAHNFLDHRIGARAGFIGGSDFTPSGYNSATAQSGQKGDAASLELSLEPLKNHLKFSGEFAYSLYNRNLGVDHIRPDRAFRLKQEVQAAGFSIVSNYQFYGLEYSSIASPGGSHNRWAFDTAIGRRLKFISASASLADQQDNVAGDPTQPTLRNLQGNASVTISKRPLPAITLGFSRSLQDGLKLPVNFPRTRNRNDSYNVALNYGRGNWTATANGTLSVLSNFAGLVSSNRNRNLMFSGGYRFSQRMAVTPTLMLTKSAMQGSTAQTKLITVNHNVMLVKNLLNFSGSVSWSFNNSRMVPFTFAGAPPTAPVVSSGNSTTGSSQITFNLARWFRWYGHPTFSFRTGYSRFGNPAQPSLNRSDVTFGGALEFASPFRLQ